MTGSAAVHITLLLVLVGTGCRCKEAPAGSHAGDRPAVVMVDPDEAQEMDIPPEQEPNDRRSAAQRIEPQGWISGALGAAVGSGRPDQDWFFVPAPGQTRILQATLSGVAGLDLVLEAHDKGGQRLVQVNNSAEGGGEILVNLALGAEPVYLRVTEVKGRSGPGRYRLGYHLRPPEEGEEQEPNWKSTRATPLTLDGEAMGYLGWRTDTDWYRVEAGELSSNPRLRVEYDGLDGVRAGLSLRDSEGAVIQERWSGPGEELVLANLVPPPGRAPFFVVLRCRGDTNVESRYYLRVLAGEPRGLTEGEPNDLPEQANVLARGQPTAGLLTDIRDHDLFRLKVESPAAVRVEVSAPLGLDVALASLDEKGQVLRESNEGEERHREVITPLHQTPPGGLVRVRAPGRGAVSSVASYHIKLQLLQGQNWEREPNDLPQSATLWIAPEMRGFIHPAKDVDLYRVTSSDEWVVVRLRKAPSGTSLRLELLDPSGISLASATAGSHPGTQVAGIRAGVTAGSEVLLRVSDPTGASNPDEEYVIEQEGP